VAVDDLEFREFFASQYARLCWLGYLLSGDRAEAEELAQDALVRRAVTNGPRRARQPWVVGRTSPCENR
jgi:DNA-directed RNA polymerase specialized sigma24 family protein